MQESLTSQAKLSLLLLKMSKAGLHKLAASVHTKPWEFGLYIVNVKLNYFRPILVKVHSLSNIWLLNALGCAISYIAIKLDYSKVVLTYRGLTMRYWLACV